MARFPEVAGLPPILAVRRSFRWKLLLAMIGSVALLAAITLAVVRRETGRQIELATRLAEQRSEQAFVELEEHNQAQLSQLSTVFTSSVQAAAALEGALEAGDAEALRQDVNYEFDARRIPHSLVAFTDGYGDPVLALLNREALKGEDPAGVLEPAERILYEGEDHIRGYRLVDGRLFSVETLLLDLGRPIGTVTVGVPITDVEVRRLGTVIGAEVCFVVGGRCVAGTARDRPEIEAAMVAIAGSPTSVLGNVGPERWRLLADRLAPDDDAIWRVIAFSLEPVEAPFQRVQRALAAGALGALLLAGVLSSALSRSLTRPVHALVRATSRLGAGDYDARVEVRSIDEMGVLARAFNQMAEGLALKERYRGVLDKVVSKDVADELLKGEVVLGGEKREVTVLFGDITGFTGLTDGMEPSGVIALLNECMELLTAAIEAEGGVVDKYVGDEIMALFGAPVSRGRDALRAARAAMEMQRAMAELNRERDRRGEPPLAISVGLNTGVVMAGNMGSTNRLNYTVLGDAVNLAARVEQRASGGQVLLTEATLRHVRDQVRVRDLGPAQLRGFAHPVGLYELLEVIEPPEAAPRSVGIGTAVQGGVVAAALLLAAPSAHAQGLGELPTLEGLYVASASGWFQLGFSGRLDVEAYLPQDDPPWMIPSTSAFVAPRLRVFSDAFFGERIVASAELRVDRGEEPAAGDIDARIDQAFVRLVPDRRIAVQAGKFVSPFAGYPQRHHTGADPLIRPPLLYDHRTVLSARRAPVSPVELLAWKDSPEENRPTGAPVVWGAPYQWGGMVLGHGGPFSVRGALMNSAPSSEPDEWGLSRGFGAPSWVANAGVQVAPWLRLEASYNVGPWLREDASGLPEGASPGDYDQRIWGGEAIFTYGRTKLRGEVFHDTWGVPNAGYGVVDVSWYVEGEHGFGNGLSLAARYGAIHFLLVEGSGETADPNYVFDYTAKWDYDVGRAQLGASYRLARNAGVRAELTLNHIQGPHRVRNNLGAAQLWWEF